MALPSINSINSNGEDPKDFLFGGTPIKLPEVVITTNKIPHHSQIQILIIQSIC